MEICMWAFIGLCLGAFGALFSAVPWQGFDSLVWCVWPKYRQANSGLQRLQLDEKITQSNNELAALNWLLKRLGKSDAHSLSRKKGDGAYFDITTGETAPAGQLLLNERDQEVASFSQLRRELDSKIRDDRVYAGLGIMAVGFILQIIGIFLC